MFKVGEKVCFLNEKREGIVTKIINNKMVNVAIEDGFEIPVLASELAPIIMPGYIQNKKTSSAPVDVSIPISDIEQTEDNPISSINTDLQNKGVYLAFTTGEKNNSLSDGFKIFLVNNTSYDLLFAYYLKNSGTDYDRLDAASKYLLQHIDRSQTDEWSNLRFQILFFKKGNAAIKDPLDKEVKIKAMRLYHEENYKQHAFLDEKSLLITLYGKELNETEKPNELIQQEPLTVPDKNEPSEKPVSSSVHLIKEPFPEKYVIDRKVAEVDLHIDELLDSIEGMTNKEMLTYQVNFFIKMLESAISNKFFKIIFIHGIGNGKLKGEIRSLLLESYPFLKVYDASMAKYGTGATEVQIPVNVHNFQNNKN